MAPVVSSHPNATTATGSGGIGVLIVWALGYFGVSFPNEVGAIIATGSASLALLIGKKGIHGLARTLWRGSSG